jgi:dihydrofolate synthase/folylpolyglutamate synthase
MNTYKEVLDYLYSCLPMFQRVGAPAYKADLSLTVAWMDILGHPYRRFPVIHVGGTNGKGSVTHYLASVLQEAGYKTGLFTSPHLIDYRERIKIDGKWIDENYIIEFVKRYKKEVDTLKLSFFEWTTGLAFQYFADQQVDVAVIEVGMGGRLDSTNVVDPVVSIVTNVSFDHQQFLGDTLEKIAFEKAGIIKPSKPFLLSEDDANYSHVFKKIALEKKAPFYTASLWKNSFENQIPADILNDLPDFQRKNLLCVWATKEIIKDKFSIDLPEFVSGVKNVSTNTGFRGRFEKLSEKPLIFIDVAHNEAGIKELLQNIQKFPDKKVSIVFGVVKDKDVGKIVGFLPVEYTYYLCRPEVPRGLPVEELAKHFRGVGFRCFATPVEALKAAIEEADQKTLIVATGSFFVVSDILQAVQNDLISPTQKGNVI